MPRITCLRKRGKKYKVYVDGELSAEVDAQTADSSGLREGVELSREELGATLWEGERALAMSRALNLLGYRARSIGEVRGRLERHGHSEGIVTEVVGRLEELGYADDEEFARSVAREKAGKYGPGRVRAELRRGGVAEDVVRGVVEEAFAGRSELEDARSWAVRRYNIGEGSDAEARRVYGFLARRGYSAEVCAGVAREFRGSGPSRAGERETT